MIGYGEKIVWCRRDGDIGGRGGKYRRRGRSQQSTCAVYTGINPLHVSKAWKDGG
jgi:hypothetical protein